MHNKGIVHRDLKLENILVNEVRRNEVQVKIIDFGLSKLVGPGELATEPFGTLGYVAPEVI